MNIHDNNEIPLSQHILEQAYKLNITFFTPTCFSLGIASDGLPSSVINAVKKTPMNMGENMNCENIS